MSIYDRPLRIDCPLCGGRCRLADHPCRRCGMTGKVPTARGREVLRLVFDELDRRGIEPGNDAAPFEAPRGPDPATARLTTKKEAT